MTIIAGGSVAYLKNEKGVVAFLDNRGFFYITLREGA